MIDLGGEEKAFARGGNRLCFIDPLDPKRCVKVLRRDRSPQVKRYKKGLLGKFKPLSWFDDNVDEFNVYKKINQHIGEAAYQHIPKCYGFIETNYGQGLQTELITNGDGLVSISMKQYIWQFGFTDLLKETLKKFGESWANLGMPSRNLLLHNIVVQSVGDKELRLVVIDGLGWPDIIPIGYFFRSVAKKKSKRKVMRLYESIESLLSIQKKGGGWGYHGWLNESNRIVGNNDQDK